MAAVLEVYFALLLLNRKSGLSGNQVSYTGAYWPLVFVTTAGATCMYRVAVVKRLPVFQHNKVFIHVFIFLWNISTMTTLENSVLRNSVVGSYAVLQTTLLPYTEYQWNQDFDFRSCISSAYSRATVVDFIII